MAPSRGGSCASLAEGEDEDECQDTRQDDTTRSKPRTSVCSFSTSDEESIGQLHRVWLEKKKSAAESKVFGRPSCVAGSPGSPSEGTSDFESGAVIAVPKGYRKTQTDIIWEDSCRMQKFERFLLHLTMRPNSFRRFAWDIAGMALIIFDLVTIPLGAFEIPDTLFTQTMGWFTSCFWAVDIPCSLITGYHADGVVELRPRLIAARYARSWLPFDVSVVSVDLLISVVAATSQMAMGDDATGYSRLGRALRFLRLFRLLRLLKMQGFIDDLSERIKSEYVLILLGILKLLAFILVMNHLVACGWYGLGSWDPSRRDTWVQENGLPQKSLAYSYFTALHWSITQFTPASMEVVPENEGERAFTVLVIIFAMVAFSSFVSTITGAMTQLRNLNSEKHAELSCLRSFLTQNRVDADLTTRIWRCLKMTMAKDPKRIHLSDVAMVSLLPWKVKSDLRDQVFHPILSQHPFFFRLRAIHLAEQDRINQSALKEIFRGPGQEVFLAAEAAQQMYFVASGVLDYTPEGAAGENVEVTSGQWAAEAVLWIRWRHTGQLATRTRVGLVTVVAEAAQVAMRNLPESGRYARAFAAFCSENPEDVTDIWSDSDDIESFVETAFEGPRPVWTRKTTQMAAWMKLDSP